MTSLVLLLLLSSPPPALLRDTVAIDTLPIAPVTITVNVPSSTLTLSDTVGNILFQAPVSEGTAQYPTPVRNFMAYEITWAPDWNPPHSTWALARHHELPGATNPMGPVKIRFDDVLFLHGTRERAHLSAPASHGCIRLSYETVLDLARLLSQAAGVYLPDSDTLLTLSDSTLNAWQKNHTTHTRILAARVPVHITYQRLALTSDTLFIYPDVYHRVPLTLDSISKFLAPIKRRAKSLNPGRYPVATLPKI